MISRFSILFLLVMASCFPHALAQALADGPQISGSLSARVLAPGQQAVLSYQIAGAQQGVEVFPQVIEVNGLTLTFSGQTQRVVSANGQARREIGVRYMVLAGEAGEYEIPAQSFTVDGQELKSQPVKVTVKEGEALQDEFMPVVQLSAGKTEFWKGEVIPLEVSILVHPAVQQLSQFFPQVKTPNFAVSRFDRSPGIESREVNGQMWRAWQMDSVFTALQAGAQEFGPAEVKAEVIMPFGGGVPDPFGQQRGNRRTIPLKSNTVPVNVKELPTEGKPANFSGAVGNFEIVIQASPVTLNAGDPIAVDMAVDGTGNFDAVTAPRMETTDGWRLYEPRVSQENRAWGTEPGRKNFTQILIPEKKHTQIPAFILTYFDPQTGKYVERRSQPVALTVLGEFKSPAVAAGETKDFAASGATPPGEELGDIVQRPITVSRWINTAAAPVPVSPLLLHGVPGLLLAALLGTGLIRRIQAAAAARRPAPGTPLEPATVLSSLRQGGKDHRAFFGKVNEYLVSLQYHRPTAISVPPTPVLAEIQNARDRWLYGPVEALTHEPVPESTRRHILELLRQL